jgi:hypothetical protein
MDLLEIVEKHIKIYNNYPCASYVERLRLYQGLREDLLSLHSFGYNAREAVSLTRAMVNLGLGNNAIRGEIIMYAFRRASLEPVKDYFIREQIWRLMELCDPLLAHEIDIGELVNKYVRDLGINDLRMYLAVAENEFDRMFNEISSIEALSEVIGDDRELLEITAENHNQGGAMQRAMFESILKMLPQPICLPSETIH